MKIGLTTHLNIRMNFSTYLLFCLSLIFFQSSCNQSHKAHKDAITKPLTQNSQYIFSIGDASVTLLYKLQRQIASTSYDSLQLRKMVIDRIYVPNERLFSYCLGYDQNSFADKYSNALKQRSDSLIQLTKTFEKINLDSTIINTMKKIAEKSVIKFEGKYVIGFFEDAGCIMCGCDNATMLGNTYNSYYKNPNLLKVVIAHEINHNFFETAKKADPDNNTLLYNAIDEGFANLFSMKMMDVDKFTAFNMTKDEYNWLENNEAELKEKFRKVIFSTKEEDWNPYSEKIPNRILEGSPGDIGYFLGYRIIEEWLKKNDGKKWEDVYSTPVRHILRESEYFK
ncbi:gliding motility protein GldB-related protein [Aquiflexum lacus]|uniref:gliding motility protein GldB-related protein n=1 Tax=Aquiflexum lacus TaxID=2483805 RepID=UPI001895586E|nr:DUF2268 domain-containing putative Zn-dependent protease [Aquiflexum lacus]